MISFFIINFQTLILIKWILNVNDGMMGISSTPACVHGTGGQKTEKTGMLVKSKTIGSGRPLLCVPVTSESTSGVVESIERLVKKRVDAIEWRVDCYAKSSNLQMVTTILQEVSGLLQNTILIFTYRTRAEGGMGDADAAEYETLLLTAARTGVPDFVDLEFARLGDLPMLLSTLRGSGVRVIASYHNFETTPSAAQMSKKLKEMYTAGADIAKIAVMPERFSDVCDLMKVSEAASAGWSDRALIAIAMGQLGAITRLTGEITGSCLTFVTDGPASAPGQMSYEKVRRAVEEIHACITEGNR